MGHDRGRVPPALWISTLDGVSIAEKQARMQLLYLMRADSFTVAKLQVRRFSSFSPEAF